MKIHSLSYMSLPNFVRLQNIMWHLTPQYKEIWKKKNKTKFVDFFFFSRIRAPGVEYWLQQLGSVHRYNFFKIISKQKKNFSFVFSLFFLLPKIRRCKDPKLSIVYSIAQVVVLFVFFFGLSISIDRILHTVIHNRNSFSRYEGQWWWWWTVFYSRNKQRVNF